MEKKMDKEKAKELLNEVLEQKMLLRKKELMRIIEAGNTPHEFQRLLEDFILTYLKLKFQSEQRREFMKRRIKK